MSDKKYAVFAIIILAMASMGWGQQDGFSRTGDLVNIEDTITYVPVETYATQSLVVFGLNDHQPNEFTLYCETDKDGVIAKKCEIGKGHTLEEAVTIILKTMREQQDSAKKYQQQLQDGWKKTLEDDVKAFRDIERILNSPRPYKPTSKKSAVSRRKP
jgi:hypothetical protein